MKIQQILFFTILVLSLIVTGCEDFIEKDISKKNLTILAPADGLRTNSLAITFWWEDLDGAEEYKLQLVSPSFASTQQLLLDTVVAINRFDFQLSNPGIFQWRIKAMNNGSETGYQIRSFVIDSTTDLSSQTLSLLNPSDDLFTNNNLNTFEWTNLYNADFYHFILSDNSNGTILLDSLMENTLLTLTLYQGNFDWKVRAENSTSNTPYSQRTLNIDTSSPLTPYNLIPVDQDTVSISSTLSWSHSTDIDGDSLEIYNDSTMADQIEAEYLSSGTFSFSGTQFQFYYWRLKSYDMAGNESSWTTLRKFYVQ